VPSEPNLTLTQREATWPVARKTAYALCHEATAVEIPLGQALGLALAEPVFALSDLPAFDTASMDGWAVSAGSGPWRLSKGMLLAGSAPSRLTDGTAVAIATGALLPDGAHAVLRREHGVVEDETLRLTAGVEPPAWRQDVREQAEEARLGAELLPERVQLTPPMLGLAAAGGHDSLIVRPAPTVDVFIMGDELLSVGPSGGGRLRDSLRPQVVGWLESVGASPGNIRLLPDTVSATVEAIQSSEADLVMTTGGTARGPVDQLHPALEQLESRLVVDQVQVRPGHPMVLALVAGQRPLVGLPGNPLAAAVGFVTLAWPMVNRLRGLPPSEPSTGQLVTAISAPPSSHRLLPSRRLANGVQPLMHHGPAMLSGLAAADCLAVAPPGGAAVGEAVEVIPLPWSR
jgi:molybdopterin molybdotransferase